MTSSCYALNDIQRDFQTLHLLNVRVMMKDEITKSFEELGKLAIDYSDGVIAAHKNVNKELLKYAKTNKIPTLAFPGEDFADAYEAFYEQI